MAEATMPRTVADEESEMHAAINDSFAEMRRIRAEMKQIQDGIQQSEERTSRLAGETKAILARIEAAIHAKANI